MIQIDMPMPTNCLDCPACNEYLTCAITINGRKWGENDVHDFSQSRPEWCPMKEQDYRKWLMDMFHKYERDDLIALLVQYGEENLLKTVLKEQEAKWVEDKQGEVCRLIKCSNCGLTFIVGNNIPYDEWIEDRNYCRRCGARMVKRND